jgi:hypothetical protein
MRSVSFADHGLNCPTLFRCGLTGVTHDPGQHGPDQCLRGPDAKYDMTVINFKGGASDRETGELLSHLVAIESVNPALQGRQRGESALRITSRRF